MRLLLDTHILIWSVEGSASLLPRIEALILDPDNTKFVSVASLWEIAIKVRKNRLDVDLDRLSQEIVEANFEVLPILATHVAATNAVELPHGDPFDRLLVAQCLAENMRLLTVDRVLKTHAAAIA